ncbi:MAG: glycosyltransferase [Cyanobacteria bacterium P01_H01_bin.15]
MGSQNQKFSQLTDLRQQLSRKEGERQLLEYQLRQSRQRIAAMESSTFWQLRSHWFRVREGLGIKDEAIPFSFKAILYALAERWQRSQITQLPSEPWPVDKPLVSVIIPCFNYGRFLPDAVASIQAQSFKNFETIIVNDGSTDLETLEVLAELENGPVEIIHQSNRKLPAARNTGIRAAQGRYICCLDADDCLEPTYLEKCLVLLEVLRLDVAYSWQREFGYGDMVIPTSKFCLETLLEHNCCIVPAVFRKEIWQKVNGYDEHMVIGYEDWEYWLRLARAGGKGGEVQEPLFLYRKHGPSMIDDAQAKHHELIDYIQAKHRDLYPAKPWRAFLRKKQEYRVQSGYANLLAAPAIAEPSAQPQVLFLLPYFAVGGAEAVARQVLQGLIEGGGSGTLVTTETLSDADNSADQFAALTSDIHPLPRILADSSLWLEYVTYLIRSRNLNAIYLAGSTWGYDALPSLKQMFPELRVINPIYLVDGHTQRHQEYAELIDYTVIENRSLAATLDNRTTQNLRLIANGVDTDYFYPQSLGSWSDPFVVGFLGRFVEQKGIETLLAITEACRDESRLQFVFAGDGELKSLVEQKINRLGLADRVKLLGVVEPREFLASIQLLLLPSQWEGRPNAVLESLAMGVPVVASAVGGLPELIQEGQQGFLCQPGDVVSFVKRLKQVCDNPTLYRQLANKARAHACHALDVTQMRSQYLDLFREAIAINSLENRLVGK